MAISDRLSELLHQYFELGVAEGREGRTHDTEAGDAQRVLSEIEYEIVVHRLAKATSTDIKVLASQVAEASLASVNAHSSRAIEIASAHVERVLVASALSAQVQDVAETDFIYRIEYDYRSYVEKKTMWGLYRELGVVALEEAQEALRTAQQNNAGNFRISRKPVVKWEPLPAAPAKQEG